MTTTDVHSRASHGRSLARAGAAAALALACGGTASCGGGSRGAKIAEVDYVDYTAPALVRDIASRLDRPFVVELLDASRHERFDLKMADTDERSVLEELVRREPRYEFHLGRVLLYHPTAAAGPASVWSRRVDSFEAEGGAASVVHRLLVDTGLSDVPLQADAEGRNRPVKIRVRGKTYREIFGEVALQAHLAFDNDPGIVRMHGL